MTALSSDDSPVYIRLRSTIAAGILRGDYRAGDQLPSVRALAAEHGANPLTVANVVHIVFSLAGGVILAEWVRRWVARTPRHATSAASGQPRCISAGWPAVGWTPTSSGA